MAGPSESVFPQPEWNVSRTSNDVVVGAGLAYSGGLTKRELFAAIIAGHSIGAAVFNGVPLTRTTFTNSVRAADELIAALAEKPESK